MRFSLTQISIVAILVFSIGRLFYTGNWQREEVIISDARGYCAYLSAFIVHRDPLLKRLESNHWEDRGRYWVYQGIDGTLYPKMTIGVALLCAPLYAGAHFMAAPLGFKSDGWSAPYQLSVALSGVIWLLIGLICIRSALMRRFNDKVVALTLLLIFFATNLMYYATDQVAFSHVFSFGVLALCCWLCFRWVETSGGKWLFLLMVAFAFLVLIRPTNAVFVLVPSIMWWGSASSKAGRLKIIQTSWLIAGGIMMLTIISLQFVYWHAVSGHYIFNSYGEERLYLTHPHLILGYFSYRNGWLLYTPIMTLIFPGILILRKKWREMSTIVLTVLLVHSWVVFSWWCWYYGDSWSIRPMIDAYPIFSFPLAAVISFVFEYKRSIWKWGFYLLSSFMLVYNILQFRQYTNGSLSGSEMSSEAFWKLFFNPVASPHIGQLGYFHKVDTDNLRKGVPERCEPDTLVILNLPSLSETKSLDTEIELNGERQYGPSLTIDACDLPEGWFYIEIKYEINGSDLCRSDPRAVITFEDSETNHQYMAIPLKDAKIEEGKWQRAKVLVEIPKNLTEGTEMKTFIWRTGKGGIEVRDIQCRVLSIDYR